ncbi:hypothetical protein ACFSTI_27650 [Rhizorhabdus histidinilytica]
MARDSGGVTAIERGFDQQPLRAEFAAGEIVGQVHEPVRRAMPPGHPFRDRDLPQGGRSQRIGPQGPAGDIGDGRRASRVHFAVRLSLVLVECQGDRVAGPDPQGAIGVDRTPAIGRRVDAGGERKAQSAEA